MSNQPGIVFDALGDPTRRDILGLLRDGPQPVGQLADRLPVGRPNVSKHLRVLADAGLVTHRQVGTRNLYAVAPDGLADAQRWLVELWDEALQAFAADVADVSRGQPAHRASPTHRASEEPR